METNTVKGTNGGMHVAGQPLTTKKTTEVVPSLLRNAIDERIVRVRPMSTPVDQISRCIGARACSSMTVEYYSVDNRAGESKVAKAVDAAQIAATDENYIVKIQVEDPRPFAVTDTVLLPGIRLADGQQLAGYVAEVRDDMLSVVALNLPVAAGKASCPAIAVGETVVRMGRAAAELDVQTSQFQALPRKRSNNCQIFKMQVEQSTLQKLASKEVDWNFSDQEEAAIMDMRLGMEKNFLFGVKGRITAPNGSEHVYLTGGIWNQASNEVKLDLDGLDEQKLLDLCSEVFTGNNGSKKRILMGGTGLILALNKVQFNRAVTADQSLTRWGIRFREIVSNFGTLYVVHSEIFDKCGHANDGFILDPDYVTKYSHIPFSKERIDLRRAGDRNTDAVVLTEASCIVLRHPDVHFRLTAVGAPATGGGEDNPF